MKEYSDVKKTFREKGFAVINNIFNKEEIQIIITAIENTLIENPSFRKSKDLFAIRRFLMELPRLTELIFTKPICEIITQLFGQDYFIVKSIYFDKPPASNWFVPYHQDITIAVDKKVELERFTNWTVKQNNFAVQPPLSILRNNFTLRIHLDDTNENNGALKVIPASHTSGIVRPETLRKNDLEEAICKVKSGGIMLMRPLLFHASNKTVNESRRRVIHIEFSNKLLPSPLQWAEYQKVNYQY